MRLSSAPTPAAKLLLVYLFLRVPFLANGWEPREAQHIVALLAVFALGNWPLASWLEEAPLRFLFYWAGCAFLAIFLFLLGLYDFLRIIKEYKDVRGKLQ